MDDVLNDRRTKSDLQWILRRYKSPIYAYGLGQRISEKIKENVLGSQGVQHVIQQLAIENNRSHDDLENEASAIIDQMGHRFTLKAVRFFGLLLAKTFKRLYTSIDVNLDGLETVRQIVPNCPILLMPTHRSYVDFLVVSYIFFHYNLPLPVVAAGQDFMSMKVMGRLMRHAGAFFIRRLFRGDRLYWAIFTEYLGTHVTNGEAPIEFFIEGTRSRSGKSLFPKYGLLTAVLEPFFKARVPDIAIVPIAITYDRTLEETLYAHELLGVPKPKESTRGLLKALQILGDNYGSIKMIVGKPISVREYCLGKIDRSVHSCSPRHISPITPTERELVSNLAHDVIDRYRELLPIRPFVVIAATVRAMFTLMSLSEISIQRLALDVRLLIDFLERLGIQVDWPGKQDPIQIIRDTCKIHRNVVEITETDLFRLVESEAMSSILEDQSEAKHRNLQRNSIMNTAVSNLILDHYGNQILGAIVPEGILALVILNNNTENGFLKEWAKSEYIFLENIFQLEFVIFKRRSEEDFLRAFSIFTESDALVDVYGRFSVKSNAKIVCFLAALFEPFVLGYRVLCQELLMPFSKLATEDSLVTAKELAKRAQMLTMHTLQKDVHDQRRHYSALSLELLMNGIHTLENLGAIRKESSKSDGVSQYGPVQDKLLAIAQRLDPYSRYPFGDLPTSTILTAKL